MTPSGTSIYGRTLWQRIRIAWHAVKWWFGGMR